MFHVLLSLPAVLVGLAFGKDGALHGVGDDGQMGYLLYASCYHLTLVVATTLQSVGCQWDGDDGIYAVEETLLIVFVILVVCRIFSFLGDEAPYVDAYFRAVEIFQFVDDVAGQRVAFVPKQGYTSLNGDLPPEHLCHLILVVVVPGMAIGQPDEARGAKHLFRP